MFVGCSACPFEPESRRTVDVDACMPRLADSAVVVAVAVVATACRRRSIVIVAAEVIARVTVEERTTRLQLRSQANLDVKEVWRTEMRWRR